MPRLVSLFVLGLSFGLAHLGCASTSSPPPPAVTHAADDIAPYPYTVDQIRSSCHRRTLEYEIAVDGKPPVHERWDFSDVDADTARITTTTHGNDGAPLAPPEVEIARWAELHEHARFPRAATTITEESLPTPMGPLDCQRYVVVTDGGTKTLWFAKTLPGPPVQMVVTKGGAPGMTMRMVASRSE